MSITKNPPINLLPDIFRAYPEIRAVYLFGSQAGGENLHAESDLDLAILPRSSALRAKK